MDESRINRINSLFDKLITRVEHEVDTEGHELNPDMVNSVIALQEYKEEVVQREEQAKLQHQAMSFITQAMKRPKEEK